MIWSRNYDTGEVEFKEVLKEISETLSQVLEKKNKKRLEYINAGHNALKYIYNQVDNELKNMCGQ